MAPPRTVVTTPSSSLLLIYRPRKDERLSWPSWLTYSGRFTHISGHPSAVGRAQDRKSSPVKDQRSTTEPYEAKYIPMVQIVLPGGCPRVDQRNHFSIRPLETDRASFTTKNLSDDPFSKYWSAYCQPKKTFSPSIPFAGPLGRSPPNARRRVRDRPMSFYKISAKSFQQFRSGSHSGLGT